MIILNQFPQSWNLPNPSPFCLKVETFLRMANIPYKSQYILDPKQSPSKQLPFITDDGKALADSSRIIRYLQEHYHDIDKQLSAADKNAATAIQRICEDHLYWVGLYDRWVSDQGWAVTSQEFFSGIPTLLRKWIANKVRKHQIKRIYRVGLSRLNADEIVIEGKKDLDVILSYMGDSTYIFGETATSTDAIVFAFMANLIYCPIATPLKAYALEQANLVDYCENVFSVYFPEFNFQRLT